MTKNRIVQVGSVKIGGGKPFVLIAGPCVIESRKMTLNIARVLKEITAQVKVPLIFKASYDKANRTSIRSFRGPGWAEGLDVLAEVRRELKLPVLSDVHTPQEIEQAAGVLDVLQIPAFLCRQTDLLLEAGKTGKPVNIKKGQFLAPWDMAQVVKKVESTGNHNILLTERGTSFGYNTLVRDFRSLSIMRETGIRSSLMPRTACSSREGWRPRPVAKASIYRFYPGPPLPPDAMPFLWKFIPVPPKRFRTGRIC